MALTELFWYYSVRIALISADWPCNRQTTTTTNRASIIAANAPTVLWVSSSSSREWSRNNVLCVVVLIGHLWSTS